MAGRMRKLLAFKRALRESDVVVQVIDARDPRGTLSREMSRYRSKMVIAVNKCDLVPESGLPDIATALSNYRVVFTSKKTGRGLSALSKAVASVSKRETPQVVFAGYPNVGKSSLMNRIAGRKAVRVSPLPGETRGVQLISSRAYLLMDTPGMVPDTDKSGGAALVLKGAVRADRVPAPEPIAEEIISRFLSGSPGALKRLYGISFAAGDGPEKILEKIAFRRGRLLKGGEPNVFETAQLVIRDYQQGKLSFRKTGLV